jgi:hypothetical protein
MQTPTSLLHSYPDFFLPCNRSFKVDAALIHLLCSETCENLWTRETHYYHYVLHNLIVLSLFQVGNLAAPVEEWTVGGTALTSLMDVERRHGNLRQVLINCFLVLN